MVLALWVSVPMTLYLAERLWWLSHCKYWSLWVGLQYTVMDKELSAIAVWPRYQGREIAPLPWVPSTVNLIAGSMLLMSSRNACLWACCWMTYVSSTNLYHTQGGLVADMQGFSLKILHVQIGNYRAYGWAHRCSLNLLIEFILKRKVSIMETEPQKFNDVLNW